MKKAIVLILLSLLITVSLSANLQNNDIIERLKEQQLRIIVMRHGEAVSNVQRIVTSSRSPGLFLTPCGQAQVKLSGKRIKKEHPDFIYVSPVYRTLQTAQLVSQELQLPHEKVRVDDRLREQNFGIYENHTADEYTGHFSSKDLAKESPPEGESAEAVIRRTEDFLYFLADTHTNQTILIVTHGFNFSHICEILTGRCKNRPKQAEYKLYDFAIREVINDKNLYENRR